MVSRNKRILVIAEFDVFGGTRSFLFKVLLPVLSELDAEIIVLLDENKDYNEIKAFSELINVVKIPQRSNFFRKNYISLIYDLYINIKYISRIKPDCIILSIGTPWDYLGLFFKSNKIIYILHTMPDKLSKKVFLMKYVLKYFTSKKKFIVTVSKSAKLSIMNIMKVSDKNCKVIYNGVKKNYKLVSFSASPKIILTAGHLENYKNIDTWLEVAFAVVQKYHDVKFVWIGEGSEYDRVKNKIQMSGFENSILLPGFIKETADYFLNAYIYFQPSVSESHGIAVLEAMSYGLPCVVSNAGGLKESVVHNKTGLVCDIYNIDLYTRSISKYLNDNNLASMHGLQGKKRLEMVFNIDKQKTHIKNEVKSLLRM